MKLSSLLSAHGLVECALDHYALNRLLQTELSSKTNDDHTVSFDYKSIVDNLFTTKVTMPGPKVEHHTAVVAVTTGTLIHDRKLHLVVITCTDLKGKYAKLFINEFLFNKMFPTIDITALRRGPSQEPDAANSASVTQFEGWMWLIFRPALMLHKERKTLELVISSERQLQCVGKLLQFGPCGIIRSNGEPCKIHVDQSHGACVYHSDPSYINRANARPLNSMGSSSNSSSFAIARHSAAELNTDHLNGLITPLGEPRTTANSIPVNDTKPNPLSIEEDPLGFVLAKKYSNRDPLSLAGSKRPADLIKPSLGANSSAAAVMAFTAAQYMHQLTSQQQQQQSQQLSSATLISGSSNVIPVRKVSKLGSSDSSAGSTVVTTTKGIITTGIDITQRSISSSQNVNNNVSNPLNNPRLMNSIKSHLQLQQQNLKKVGNVTVDITELTRNAIIAQQANKKARIVSDNSKPSQKPQASEDSQRAKLAEIDALLNRKAIHADAVEQAWDEAYNKRVEKLVEQEKKEIQKTQLHALTVKDGWHCRSCQLYSEKVLTVCRDLGHPLDGGLRLTKRFFECMNCHRRASTLHPAAASNSSNSTSNSAGNKKLPDTKSSSSNETSSSGLAMIRFAPTRGCDVCHVYNWRPCGVNGSLDAMVSRAEAAAGDRLVLSASEWSTRKDVQGYNARTSSLL